MGYASLWLWILMMFNSIVLYTNATDVRESLYITQLISLIAAVAIMLFLAIIVRPNDVFAKNRAILIASCSSMMLGTVLAFFSDSRTAAGMLILGLSSILTGIGSGAVFLCWSQVFFRIGGKMALAELAISTALSFCVSLPLSLVTAVFAMICTAVIAVVTTLLVSRCCAELYTTPQGKFKLSPNAKPAKLSHHTIFLFAKSLIGAVLIGIIEGFYDVTAGFHTYAMTETYGFYLLIAGLIAILALALIAVFFSHDSIFYTYRFSILVLCLGCLTTPFLGDNQSYVTVLIFAGYNCFCVVLFAICLDISASFVINPVRAVGAGFIALYGGEFSGELAAHGMNAAALSVPDLTVVTLGAVAILLIAHLFLFTETDLIKIGIGENYLPEGTEGLSGRAFETHIASTDADMTADNSPSYAQEQPPTHEGADVITASHPIEPTEAPFSPTATPGTFAPDAPVPPDPAAIIAERFGLSPRECDVLPLLLEGRTIVRIQETLFISAGTVSTHIRHIYQKTGQANRQELIDLAQSIAENECRKGNNVEK